MKCFVTGTTGFVGGELARQLIAAGHQVIALVRNPEKAEKLRQAGVEIVQGDVTDKDSMRAPMRGCDAVYHVAGWYKIGPGNKLASQQVNVDGTRNVLELMEELGIKKGVYTSTLAVNSDTKGAVRDEQFHFSGRHISEYDRTKAEAHEIAMEFIGRGLPLVVLMPGLIYGPGGQSLSDNALRDYKKGKLPMIPSRSAYAWAHVEDVAQAHILAMEKAQPGSVYIICGPNHTLVEGFQIAQSVTGVKAPIAVPPFLLTISSWLAALVEWLIPLPENYTSEALRVQAGVTYLGDNSKAKRDLGYNPRPLKEGLTQTFPYL